MLGPDVVIVRLLVASGLGLMIGYEREMRGRSAGLRTNMVVAVSACLLMLLSLELSTLFKLFNDNSVLRIDPGRIAAYAVAGMGFLGAGAIIQGRGSVRGLTSAASLWAGNAVGLAVGAGFMLEAVLTTALVLFALMPLRLVLTFIPQERDIDLSLHFSSCGDRIDEIRMILKDYKVQVLRIEFYCDFKDQNSIYEVSIRLKNKSNWSLLQANLRKMEDLKLIRWSQGLVR